MSGVVATSWESLRWVVVVVSVSVSVGALAVLTRSDRTHAGVRSRLLHGVPWGTVLTALFVVAVYLFVQGGLSHPRRPLVVPFRSWSYAYPLGMVTAAFSHSSWAHLTGNLVATVAYASVAEYAWGHYPRGRGTSTFSRWSTNPYARILAVPVASIAVGLFTALFALGPVIGFSGVVFAYAGFAFVHRPLLAILAIFGSRLLDLVLTAVTNPQSVASPRPRVVTPWWTEVAIQGHAIGFLAGLLLGVWLARKRDDWADPRYLWFGLLAFASYQGLWAVYVPGDDGSFTLFRWIGVALVFVFAVVIVVGATREWETPTARLGTWTRLLAIGSLVVLLVGFSASGVVYNVAPVGEQDGPEPSVQVRDYSVGYAENVEDRYVGSIRVPIVDYSPRVNTSGVIVTSERRSVWRTMIHPARLENRGRDSVLLGGLGWRERVYVNRTGWSVAGNGSVYQVYLEPNEADRTLAFASDSRRADPVVAGRNISLRSTDASFELVVSRNGRSLETAPVPGRNGSVEAGGISFQRSEDAIYAVENRTRVRVAKRDGNG